MKALVLLLIVISTFFNAKAYEVENGKQQGFTVSADNLVYITTPTNEKIQVTKVPFVGEENGYHYSIPPVEPILCMWDPSHTWLGIFITVSQTTKRQTTEIDLFNLRTKLLLTAETDRSKYPAWFAKPQWSVTDKPVRWSGNKLFVDTLVKFRDESTRHLSKTIVINGDTFKIIPESK
jgi:hypothetical protein